MRHPVLRSATLDGIPAGGGPVEVVVLPADTSATASTLHITDSLGRYPLRMPPPTAGLRGSVRPPANEGFELVAGDEGSFTIVARDAYGNQRDSGGESFYVVLQRVDATTDQQPAALPIDRLDIADRGDGSYTVRFVRTVAGVYEARAWLHGEALPGALPCRVAAGTLSVARCTTRGVGLSRAEAGASTEVWIEARDWCGNLVGVGGEAWRVRIEAHPAEDPRLLQVRPSREAEEVATAIDEAAAAAEASLQIRDCGDGRYCLSYQFSRAALYAVHIAHASRQLVAGTALPGSPFALLITPSAADPSSTAVVPSWQADEPSTSWQLSAGVAAVVKLQPQNFGDEALFRQYCAPARCRRGRPLPRNRLAAPAARSCSPPRLAASLCACPLPLCPRALTSLAPCSPWPHPCIPVARQWRALRRPSVSATGQTRCSLTCPPTPSTLALPPTAPSAATPPPTRPISPRSSASSSRALATT